MSRKIIECSSRNNVIPGAVGIFGEQHQNINGESVIMFVTNTNLKITNNFVHRRMLIAIPVVVEEVGI